MKKTSIIVKEKDNFDIKILINNTALIESVTGKTGLLNIKTNKIIGKLDNYYTIYDSDHQFYMQEKDIEDPDVSSWNRKKTIIIYDAKTEKVLVDGWERVKQFKDYNRLISVKSPIDGSIHIFDKALCRKKGNIFNMAFDAVESLFSRYGDEYLVVSKNGKKGLYLSEKGLTTDIEFDNIERINDEVILYTKNNRKYFVCNSYKEQKTSIEFDEIEIDKDNKKIVYCRDGNRIYVYNLESKELVVSKVCDNIKFCGNEKSGNGYYGKFYFVITQGKHKGLVVVEMKYNNKNNQVETNETQLLPIKYDDIDRNYSIFYTMLNNKKGLFQESWNENVCIEPAYDDIKSLDSVFYAFYNGERCDISKITDPFDPTIRNCKIIETQRQGLIFEKNNLYGILQPRIKKGFHEEDFLLEHYNNVSYIDNGYYQVEKQDKKGIVFRGVEILSPEYDSIQHKLYEKKYCDQTMYFALEKKDKGFELAKKRHWDYDDSEIEYVGNHVFKDIKFFEDIMVLKTDSNSLIYDYEEKLLKKLPVNTEVSMILRKPDSTYDKEPLYVINEKNYYYKDGKFEEVLVEENDLYITTYETETDAFEIKTFDKTEHDSFCGIIDSQDDTIAEQSLIDIFENNSNKIRQQHKTLVLKRTTKKRNI